MADYRHDTQRKIGILMRTPIQRGLRETVLILAGDETISINAGYLRLKYVWIVIMLTLLDGSVVLKVLVVRGQTHESLFGIEQYNV